MRDMSNIFGNNNEKMAIAWWRHVSIGTRLSPCICILCMWSWYKRTDFVFTKQIYVLKSSSTAISQMTHSVCVSNRWNQKAKTKTPTKNKKIISMKNVVRKEPKRMKKSNKYNQKSLGLDNWISIFPLFRWMARNHGIREFSWLLLYYVL